MLSLLGTLAVATVPTALLRTFVVGNYVIPSESMAPTLRTGDRVLSERLGRHSRPLDTGDVVTFLDPDIADRTLIKRIVATAGQTVEIKDGHLLVDGTAQDEPHVLGPTCARGLGSTLPHPYRVPEGHVFVMGDNREHSMDSRSFGAIPTEAVGSRAQVVYWPPAHKKLLS